jgi:hypothetical protein
VRYALTENPVAGRPSEQPVVPEFFRLVKEAMVEEGKVSEVAKDGQG